MFESYTKGAIVNDIIDYISLHYTTEQLVEYISTGELEERLHSIFNECVDDALNFIKDGISEDALADAHGMSVEEYRELLKGGK